MRFFGHYLAFFGAANYLNLDHTGLLYNVPGKLAQIGSARNNAEAIAGFVFASGPLDYDHRDVRQQKQIVVGAYVLAGELASAGDDHRVAFANYEEQIRDYARGCQKLAEGAGPFLAPPTYKKIQRRNRALKVLSFRPLAGIFNRMSTKAANAKNARSKKPTQQIVEGIRLQASGYRLWCA